MMELSRKKKKWANSRASSLMGILVGKGITKNSKADIYYRNAADKEARKFIQSLIDELKQSYPIVKTDNSTAKKTRSKSAIIDILMKAKKRKFQIYQRNMYRIIEKWLALAKTNAKKSVRDSIFELAGKQISIEYDKGYDDDLKLILQRNVQLITNVASQTITNIENIVYDGMTNGEGWNGIIKGLEHQPEISARRIKLIARDQTAKTNQALNMLSQKSAGIKFFMWKTAGDERVSAEHRKLDGKIYAWNEPQYYPIIDAYGHRGIPSQRPNCYHKDTEVLTADGFKYIKDVEVGEKIATINPETRQWEWSECTNKIKAYKENIINLHSNIFNLRVSENHRFFCFNKKYKGKKVIPNSEYPVFCEGIGNLPKKETRFLAACNKFIGKRPQTIAGIKTEIFCKFLGYYLSDGNIDKRTNNCIHITQTNNDWMYNELKDYITVRQGKEKLFIYNKELFAIVAPLGHCYTKRIPEFIKELDSEYIRIFLDAFAKCDGTPAHKVKGKHGFSNFREQQYYTTSPAMMSDLVECIYKTGKSASVYTNKTKGKEVEFKNGKYKMNYDLFVISELKNNWRKLSSCKIEKQIYNDFVYDIEVKDNHTLLIKDKQSIHWNSNCRCDARPVWILQGYEPLHLPDGSYEIIKSRG